MKEIKINGIKSWNNSRDEAWRNSNMRSSDRRSLDRLIEKSTRRAGKRAIAAGLEEALEERQFELVDSYNSTLSFIDQFDEEIEEMENYLEYQAEQEKRTSVLHSVELRDLVRLAG